MRETFEGETERLLKWLLVGSGWRKESGVMFIFLVSAAGRMVASLPEWEQQGFGRRVCGIGAFCKGPLNKQVWSPGDRSGRRNG